MIKKLFVISITPVLFACGGGDGQDLTVNTTGPVEVKTADPVVVTQTPSTSSTDMKTDKPADSTSVNTSNQESESHNEEKKDHPNVTINLPEWIQQLKNK